MVLEVPLYIPLAFAVMKLRGFLTVATAGVFLVLADLVQRLVIVPLVWVAPARKERVLAAWQRWIAGNLIGMARVVEGAKFEPIPTIPSAPGVLVLMNHQSSWTSRSWCIPKGPARATAHCSHSGGERWTRSRGTGSGRCIS
jgi:hypothetical protein